MVSDSWAGAIMAYTHSIYIPNIYLSYVYLLKMGAWVAQWVRSYSTERDIPWSITVIVIMFRRVMGIKILNSCRWSGGNKTPGVNLVITRFHKILLITLRHINVLHEDITYIQYYMAKWSYIIKNIKTYQQFSLWTMIIFNKLLHYKKIGDHSF